MSAFARGGVAAAPAGGSTPSGRHGTRRWLNSLWPVTLAALAVRVAVVLASPHYRPMTDAVDFNRLAVNLARSGHFGASIVSLHGGPTAVRPPVFPWLLSLVYRIVGTTPPTSWEWGRMCEALCGAIAVSFIWSIARRLWGTRVAHVAGALAAIYPPLVMAGSSLLSESVFIPVALAAVWAGLRARADRARPRAGLGWSALAGVLVSLAALSRTNGAVLGLPLLCLVWTGRPYLTRRAVGPPLILIVAAALTLVPWTVRNAEVFHQFVPTSTETGFALEGVYNAPLLDDHAYEGFWSPPFAQTAVLLRTDPQLNEAQLSTRLTHEALDYIRDHPTSLAYESWWNLRRLLDLSGYRFAYVEGVLEGYPARLIRVSMISFWIAALLALAGFAVLIRDRVTGRSRRSVPAAFWWCPAIMSITLLPLIGDSRYRVPVDPFLLMAAAVALVRAGEWTAARAAQRSLRAAQRAPRAPLASAR